MTAGSGTDERDLRQSAGHALARRLEADAGPDLRKQIDLGYRLVAGRPARPNEVREALEFLATQPKREFALTLLISIHFCT